MNNTIHLEVKRQYVLILSSGTFNLSDAADALRQSLETIKEKKLQKLLMDARKVTGSLSIMDRFNFAVTLEKLIDTTNTRHVKIALVADESVVDPARFGETVAANQGIMIKVTTDFHEAEAWLEK
jgi:hypothetical protein